MPSDDADLHSSDAGTTWPATSATANPDPERIGRFKVRRQIGSGGMGVVYAAKDEELNRTVAIKLLHDDAAHSKSLRDRLRTEAQLMARLSHPQVVPVFEVGEHNGSVFVVMEYVRGTTLRVWIEEDDPGWEDALRAYLKAACGLAAAHAAGIVHRDFKPENVLHGTDGRVLVVDFGLARTEVTGNPAASLATPVPVPPTSTLSGRSTLAGTPAYMSPEQIRGERGDARSDQFAFAVAVWEALYGEHPFGTRRWPALALAVVQGDLHLPADPGQVPVRLQHALQRALQSDPDQRWPSIAALTAELRRAAWPPTRRRALLATAGVVAIATASALGYEVGRDDALPGCERPASTWLGDVWGEALRQELTARYEVVGQPHVQATWDHVRGRVGAWSARWAEQHAQACAIADDADDEARALARLRGMCLLSALDSVDVLSTTMRELDPLSFANGDAGLGQGLADLSVCANDKAVSRRIPEPQSARDEIHDLRVELARARTVGLSGDGLQAQAILDGLPDRAAATDYAPLRAEVAFAIARRDGSEQALRDAVLEAERTANDAIAAKALLALAGVVSLDRDADLILARAEAAVERAGAPAGLRLAVSGQAVEQALQRGKIERALSLVNEHVQLVADAEGADSPSYAWALRQRGVALLASGADPAAARDALQTSVQAYERALGSAHPEVVWALAPLADALDANEEHRAADLTDNRIVDLLRRAHPMLQRDQLAHAYYRQAIRRFARGESYALAVEFAAEAVQVMERSLGAHNPKTYELRYYLARIRVAIGQLDQAKDDVELLLESPDSLGDPLKITDAYGMWALIAAAAGDASTARQRLQQARGAAVDANSRIQWHEWAADVAERSGQVDLALAHAELAWALWAPASHRHKTRSLYRAMTRVGRLRLLAGHLRLAQAPLAAVVQASDEIERAPTARPGRPAWPFVPDAQFGLARIYLDQGDRIAARAMAERAYAGYGSVGAGRASARAEVSSWLASLTSQAAEPPSRPK